MKILLEYPTKSTRPCSPKPQPPTMSSSLEAKIVVLGAQGTPPLPLHNPFIVHKLTSPRSRQNLPRPPVRQKHLHPDIHHLDHRRLLHNETRPRHNLRHDRPPPNLGHSRPGTVPEYLATVLPRRERVSPLLRYHRRVLLPGNDRLVARTQGESVRGRAGEDRYPCRWYKERCRCHGACATEGAV